MIARFLISFGALFLLASSPCAQEAKQEAKPSAAEAPKHDARDEQFATRLFGGPLDPNKAYACYVRIYDGAHLAGHPLQKVKAMRLLVTAEPDEERKAQSYSFRMGVKFTKRPGDFDSSGACSFGLLEGSNKPRLGCGVDCDGGGISIEMKDNKSTYVRLERIRIWQNNKPDEDGLDLSGGADDKIFRLDRAKLDMCKSLITDRKELAAIRTLKKN